MANHDLVVIHAQAASPRSLLEVLCDRPPRQQALLDRDAPGLSRSPWSMSIGSLDDTRQVWQLHGVQGDALACNPWLADWLLARARLSILLVDDTLPDPETALRALLEQQQARLRDRELAVMIRAEQQPDGHCLARYFAILRQFHLYGPVEWAPTRRAALLANLRLIGESTLDIPIGIAA